ncbi:unnamed protein product [Penicillium glandicola]
MSGLLEEAWTPRSSRNESSKRCGTINIPSDEGLYNSPKRQTKDAIPHISKDAGVNSFRCQPQKALAGSERRAPLQQNLKALQAGATTVDVCGTGGGKENIPPGISVKTNNRSKSENHSPMSKMARPAVQNAPLRTRITTKSKEVPKERLKRVALGGTRGNIVRVPKKIEHSPPAEHPWASTLKHVVSAIVIQRAWRSFSKRRNEHACAITTAKAELAYEVITRWWLGVKAYRLRENTEPMKPMERTEPTPRGKSSSQRPSVRQKHHNSGRRGIRRL